MQADLQNYKTQYSIQCQKYEESRKEFEILNDQFRITQDERDQLASNLNVWYILAYIFTKPHCVFLEFETFILVLVYTRLWLPSWPSSATNWHVGSNSSIAQPANFAKNASLSPHTPATRLALRTTRVRLMHYSCTFTWKKTCNIYTSYRSLPTITRNFVISMLFSTNNVEYRCWIQRSTPFMTSINCTVELSVPQRARRRIVLRAVPFCVNLKPSSRLLYPIKGLVSRSSATKLVNFRMHLVYWHRL